MRTSIRRITRCLAALALAAVPVIVSVESASAAPAKSRPARGYVAMGDSFSSGEGTGVYDESSDTDGNACHRSPLAYGPLLKTTSSRLRPLSFVACSGATTRDFYKASTSDLREGPQLDALKKNTRVVTLTIGGNDAVFAPVAKACVQSTNTPGFGCSRNVQLNALITARLNALAGTGSPTDPAIIPIKQILTDIAAQSPRAQIYLAGYPELFGNDKADATADQSAPSGTSCTVYAPLAGRVDYADTQWINLRTKQLNQLFQTAVADAKTAGVQANYVEPAAFAGHGLCDSSTPWLQPVLTGPGGIRPESLHPTAEGQEKGYFAAFEAAIV
jgi:hypothetical protein